MSCVLLSSGCPAALFLFLCSHPGKDRPREGWTTAVGAEPANPERESEIKGRRGAGVNDGGRQLLLSTVDSHNKLREDRFHTETGKREPSPEVRRKHEDVKHKGLMVHKCTGWRSWSWRAESHKCTIIHSRTKNTHMKTLW